VSCARALPADAGEAKTRLAEAEIPVEILDVARTLHQCGHAGVLVGGAVRDFLLGVPHDDWDLASSATPREVLDLFPRTIPTGVEHGTVTVLVGRGDDRKHVEVTTFRGEGEYRDGRRPSEVTFLRDLAEDLARRDFTVNAFAWDPNTETFTDLYGGLDDLRAGVVRAVGDPVARFREDGLRTMRGVRFCATLGFRLDAQTHDAVAQALDVFDLVARERVQVELVKLPRAPTPSLGLLPMLATGLWPRVLGMHTTVQASEAISAVDAMPRDPVDRLARLLWPLRGDPDAVGAVLDGLKLSREDRAQVVALTGPHIDALEAALRSPGEPAAMRRAVAGLRRERLEGALAVLGVDRALREAARCACEGAALTGKELEIKGRDLIAAGVMQPGPRLGDVLDGLLSWVLEDPRRNEADALLARARELAED